MICKTVKLGDICKIINGSTPLRSRNDYWEEGTIPWFTIDDFREQGKNINYTNQKITKVALKETSVRMLPKNTVLLCCTASVGVSAIARVEVATNQQFNGLIPNTEKLLPEFLYYISTTLTQELIKLSGSATINFVAISKLKEIKIYLPSISEQQRIVAKLDAVFAEIDRGINHTQKLIEKANQLFEEKIKQYFIDNITNATIVKLSDISEYFNGLTYSPKDVSEDGLIVLRSGNIQNGKMKYLDIKRVNKKIKDKLYVKPTDILICSRNGSQRLIGKSSLIGEIKEPMTFGTFMMILRSEHNEYLQWFIKSKLFKKQILKGESTMINQITRYMLDDISLPFPDKKNYTKIVKELEELDGHIRMLNKNLNIKIDNFKALKSSILQQELLDEVA